MTIRPVASTNCHPSPLLDDARLLSSTMSKTKRALYRFAVRDVRYLGLSEDAQAPRRSGSTEICSLSAARRIINGLPYVSATSCAFSARTFFIIRPHLLQVSFQLCVMKCVKSTLPDPISSTMMPACRSKMTDQCRGDACRTATAFSTAQ